MAEKALLLVNVGTPDSPAVKDVRKYLTAFLNDPYVIDIPTLWRKILVNGIIIPFRVKQSAKLYQELWTEKGSPLLVYQQALAEKLQQQSADYEVYHAMRYGTPSLSDVLQTIHAKAYKELVVLPMFPQYATSTSESIMAFVKKQTHDRTHNLTIRYIDQFYNHQAFIQAFTDRIAAYHPETYDHVIFSYHGLPIRQVEKLHPLQREKDCTCTKEMPAHGQKCYKAACYATTRSLVAALHLEEGMYTTSYQSRLSKNWLKPFTDEVLIDLAKAGKKKVLIVAPAFVTDCLETIIELGREYDALFQNAGGKQLQMVESLNDSDAWVQAIWQIVK